MSNLLSTLLDKGIDLGTSFIPGGSLIKTIAKVLLGDENASEDKVKEALDNATPESLKLLELEIQKLQASNKQTELNMTAKQLDYLSHISGREKLCIFSALYLVLLSLVLYFHFSDYDTITKHCVIGLLSVISLLPFAPYIGGGVFNRILNSLCDIFVNIAETGKAVSSVPKDIVNGAKSGVGWSIKKIFSK